MVSIQRREFTERPYERLCELVQDRGGSVRLPREKGGWGLVVNLPREDWLPQAAGFFLADLDDLDMHAALCLGWMRLVESDVDKGGAT